MRILSLMLIFAAFLVTLQAGQAVKVSSGVGPPPWPGAGNVPKELAAFYVFFDPRTDEIVVHFPATMSPNSGVPNDGDAFTYRLPRNKGAVPAVHCSVSYENGMYRYTYRVENDPAAKEAISSLSLSSPALYLPPDPEEAVEAAALWHAGAPHLERKPRNDHGVFSPQSFAWALDDEQASIRPGHALEQFTITTKHKPGMTVLFAQSGQVSTVPANLPKEVAAQLTTSLAPVFNSEIIPTLGPQLPSDAPRAVIAENFSIGIQRMVAQGQLSQSPAITEALDALGHYISSVEAYANVPLTLQEKPRNVVEQELLQALRLAMN